MEEKSGKFTKSCDQCGELLEAATWPALKANITRHKKAKHAVAPGDTEKGEVKEISAGDKKKASLEEQVMKLAAQLEVLSQRESATAELNKKLQEKLEKNEAVIHPEHGPGPACEAYKIHKGEALQLQMSNEPGVYNPVPGGFKVRQHDMIPFLVKEETPDGAPIEEGMVSNCKSMYTHPFQYRLPKRPGQVKAETAEAHLCRKHANILLGISEEAKLDGINEIRD